MSGWHSARGPSTGGYQQQHQQRSQSRLYANGGNGNTALRSPPRRLDPLWVTQQKERVAAQQQSRQQSQRTHNNNNNNNHVSFDSQPPLRQPQPNVPNDYFNVQNPHRYAPNEIRYYNNNTSSYNSSQFDTQGKQPAAALSPPTPPRSRHQQQQQQPPRPQLYPQNQISSSYDSHQSARNAIRERIQTGMYSDRSHYNPASHRGKSNWESPNMFNWNEVPSQKPPRNGRRHAFDRMGAESDDMVPVHGYDGQNLTDYNKKHTRKKLPRGRRTTGYANNSNKKHNHNILHPEPDVVTLEEIKKGISHSEVSNRRVLKTARKNIESYHILNQSAQPVHDRWAPKHNDFDGDTLKPFFGRKIVHPTPPQSVANPIVASVDEAQKVVEQGLLYGRGKLHPEDRVFNQSHIDYFQNTHATQNDSAGW
jgi:hypothetical protein